MRNLISINDLSKDEIIFTLALAKKFKLGYTNDSLKGKIIASCFFEASTRTRLSFEAAIYSLKGQVIGFSDCISTSYSVKGESLTDTLKIIGGYANGLIIRHPFDGTARLASEICEIPVINAGDGANQHPSQTLIDLFAILESQGKLDNIHLGIMGDLKYSRTVHSLLKVCVLFGMKLYFIAEPQLHLTDNQLQFIKQSGIQYTFHENIETVLPQLDCLYMTRLQKERMGNIMQETTQHLSIDMLTKVKSNFKILHPLPRLAELPRNIDNTAYAYYFTQAKDGLYVRQALLSN